MPKRRARTRRRGKRKPKKNQILGPCSCHSGPLGQEGPPGHLPPLPLPAWKELEEHLAQCRDCTINQKPVKFCRTGFVLFMEANGAEQIGPNNWARGRMHPDGPIYGLKNLGLEVSDG